MSQGDGARNDTAYFHLFTYGTLRRGRGAEELLDGCEQVGTATVAGTLFNIDDAYPALILAGTTRVEGEVWRCPAAKLPQFDAYEGINEGLFRRVGLQVGEWACWTYVAGPKLAPRLSPKRRIEEGRW